MFGGGCTQCRSVKAESLAIIGLHHSAVRHGILVERCNHPLFIVPLGTKYVYLVPNGTKTTWECPFSTNICSLTGANLYPFSVFLHIDCYVLIS